MKKVVLAILSLIYFATASGVVIGTHYCMGRVTESGYAYRLDDICGKCGMKNKDGCCHTEFKIVKLTDDQQQVESYAHSNELPVAIIHYSISLFQCAQGLQIAHFDVQHSPPDIQQQPLYISNSVFRI